MIKSRLAGALALAAFVAVPAFAQTDTTSSTVNGASVAPLDKAAARQNAAAPEKQIKADSKRSSSMEANANVNSPSVDGAYVAPTEKAAARQNAAAPQKQIAADSKRSSSMEANANVNSPSVNGAYVAPTEKAAARQQAALDCADHPQAGKLADKSTGMAKEHSASPVHTDCVTKTKPKVAKKKSTKTASSETK